MADAPAPLVRCIGAVVHDSDGRLLLIRRAQEPGRGKWSLPGGRVEDGETDREGVVREVAEETGLTVEVGALVGSVRREAPGGAVFDIHDYAARSIGGRLCAGDDADDARWCDAATFADLPLVSDLHAILAEWGQLPR